MAQSLPKVPSRTSTATGEPVRKWKGWPHPPRFVPPPLPRCAEPHRAPKEFAKYEIYGKQAKQQRLRLKVEEVERLDFHGFGGSIEGLRAFLAHKYGGGSVRGWRTAIAPDDLYREKMGTASVTFSEFCAAMKRIGYSGNSMTLWRALSKNNNGIFCALEDFEPDLAEQLDALVKIFSEEYKNGAWDAWEDVRREHAGRATYEEFCSFLEEQELLPDEDIDLRRIFDALDVTGLGTITLKDLRFLDHWAERRFDKPLPDEPKVEKEELLPWSPPPPREPKDMTAYDFREFLEKRFGSAARAWRMMLDVKGVGHLGPSDFGMGCRQAGWAHPFHPIWRELRKEGGGLVTLRALDPQTADAIDAFNDAVRARYEDVYEFWSTIVDPNGTCSVNITEFVADVASDLGITPEQARRIFKCLDTQETGWIAVTEIGFLEVFRNQLTTSIHSDASDSTQLPKMSKSFSYASSGLAFASSSMQDSQLQISSSLGSLTNSSSLPARAPVWRSTRGIQRNSYCASTMVKRRWLRDAVLERLTVSSSEVQTHTSPQPKNGDVFRTTNEFYREGVKLLQTRKKKFDEVESPVARRDSTRSR